MQISDEERRLKLVDTTKAWVLGAGSCRPGLPSLAKGHTVNRSWWGVVPGFPLPGCSLLLPWALSLPAAFPQFPSVYCTASWSCPLLSSLVFSSPSHDPKWLPRPPWPPWYAWMPDSNISLTLKIWTTIMYNYSHSKGACSKFKSRWCESFLFPQSKVLKCLALNRFLSENRCFPMRESNDFPLDIKH